MPFARNRNAWMWLAIAAVAFTSVARAEAAPQSSRGYTHPVFEFLARSQSQSQAAHSTALRFAHLGSRRQATAIFRSSTSGPLIAMLPVLFVGLVSPLNPQAATSLALQGRAPAPPLLSALFQRPPPSFA